MASVSSSATETLIPKSPTPDPSSASEHPNPSPNPKPAAAAIAPPLPQFPPSFRPVIAPQFSPVVAPLSYQAAPIPSPAPQNAALQPPGVAFPVQPAGPVPVPVQTAPMQGAYYAPPGQPPRPYWQVPPNGYMAGPPPGQAPAMIVPPPGIPRYPAPYPAIVRPGFPPRPPMPMNVIPTISRPPGVGGPPIIPGMVRPIVPMILPAEKPQTTVYVGKIASTVENSFLLTLLELCGPVKSWKPAKNPSDGSLRGFGFCEFETAEGVLRALRLLSKLKLDGQELVLNVNQATREYLEHFVQKKAESEKLKGTEIIPSDTENQSLAVKKHETEKDEEPKTDADDTDSKDKQVDIHKFGIVTEEDKETDKETMDKLKNMIEERLRAKPLPPPPPVNVDGHSKPNSEVLSKSRNSGTEVDATKHAEDRTDDDRTSDGKASEHDRVEGSSADRSRMRDRSRERDRDRDREREKEREERDLKREKEREVERYERERERERVRRDRERDMKMREAERLYRDRLKEWEAHEREKEHQRLYEREKEKERESKRRREVIDQEEESDDDDIRKRRRRSSMEERRRRRQREKDDDLADRMKEEEEIAEAKKRAAEEQELKQKLKDESELISVEVVNENGGSDMLEEKVDVVDEENVSIKADEIDVVPPGYCGETVERNGTIDESNTIPEIKQNNNMTSRKLGFGLVASGKRSFVPSIFNEEDEDDADDKKKRPFIPIDYTEEPEVIQNTSETPSNLVAAAEFAKRLSGGNSKEDKVVVDKDRSRRSTERHKDRIRNDDNHKHMKDDSREQVRERNLERDKERDNKKLLDAKQLIDTIPKTKEELFSYEINWAVYDKHQLHERMRPWITKKITDFLGEEETSLVDYIVTSTNNHVKASDMLELLQSILDEEAEMFVLKMWRMLIFEIKKVETGLSFKSKA